MVSKIHETLLFPLILNYIDSLFCILNVFNFSFIQVNIFRSRCNLTIKTKLHSLKILDELQGQLSTHPQYLARSVVKEKTASRVDAEVQNIFWEEDDCFIDALSDFMSTPDQTFHNSLFPPDSFDQYSGCSFESGLNLGDAKERSGEVFYEAWDTNISDFVVVTFFSRSPDSPQYDGIDTQVLIINHCLKKTSVMQIIYLYIILPINMDQNHTFYKNILQMRIRMSALEFFCNRPTLFTLIVFGFDLSQVNSAAVINENNANGVVDAERKEDEGCVLVKGLLGYGKGRVVFNLVMDVDSVCVFLNKEDGSQLAMFVQESFILNLKVSPSLIVY